jgi:hypothetical protein
MNRIDNTPGRRRWYSEPETFITVAALVVSISAVVSAFTRHPCNAITTEPRFGRASRSRRLQKTRDSIGLTLKGRVGGGDSCVLMRALIVAHTSARVVFEKVIEESVTLRDDGIGNESNEQGAPEPARRRNERHGAVLGIHSLEISRVSAGSLWWMSC